MPVVIDLTLLWLQVEVDVDSLTKVERRDEVPGDELPEDPLLSLY